MLPISIPPSSDRARLGLSKAEIECAAQPPQALPVLLHNIPKELLRRRRWVAWEYQRRLLRECGWRWTKVPLCARDGYHVGHGGNASVTRPGSWACALDAWLYYRVASHAAAGIGFVLAEGDPYTGIDLDDAVDSLTGTLRQWARPIVAGLDSYTEVSPSGTGVKVMVRGRVPGERHQKDHIEMYDRARFFALTGQRLAGTPATIADRQDALDRLYRQLFGAAAKPKAAGVYFVSLTGAVNLSDADILQRAFQARNGRKFAALWNGDTSAYGGDHSVADLALCALLAFWVGPDLPRLDALFRASGLYRAKWERTDYRERTLRKALAGQAAFYGGLSAC
jgi:primase-polymerase (primpol)-like protein